MSGENWLIQGALGALFLSVCLHIVMELAILNYSLVCRFIGVSSSICSVGVFLFRPM